MALVAWYKLNGNVLDSTVNGNHGTIVGSPTVVSDGPFGSCYLFNPDNNDRITINNLSQFIYNTPFTFSAWIKTSGLGTGQTVNGIVSLTYGTRFCGNSTGSIYLNLKLSTGSYSITSSGININDNIWHHVCCTYNGDQAKLYIDGVLNNSSVTGIIQNNTYTNDGAIGMDVNDSSKYKFNGSISDVRIYDEALSLKEIKELSKAKVLHYDFNHDTTDDLVVYDKSGWNNNGIITVSTAPTYVNESIVNNGCYEFDGTQYMTPDSSIMDILIKNSFTISFWLYSNDVGGIIADVFGGGNYGHSTGGIALSHHSSNSWYLDMYLVTTGRISTTIGHSYLPFNQWNLITITRDRSNTDFKVYINGLLFNEKLSIPNENINWNKTSYPLKIGKGYYAGTQGKIADFRIYSTALSEDDIKEIYQTKASIDKNGNIYCNSIEENKYINPIVDYTSWVVGTSGVQTGFDLNGATSENYIIESSDPFNNIIPIWEARTDGVYGPSGGWITSSFNIDNTKLYRFSVWVRRTVIGDGSFYLGVYGYGSTNGVYTLANVNNTNPYFYYGSNLFTNRQDQWLLVVGYVYPYTYTGTTSPADSGVYNVDGTKIVASTTSFKWRPETTTAKHRSYLFYSTNIDTRQQWCYPRVDICDGTEPTILDLLNGIDYKHYQITKDLISSKGINKNSSVLSNEFSEVGITEGLVAYYPLNGDAKDYSGNSNHGTVYGAIKASGIAGKKCFYFNGTDDYIDCGITPLITANSFSISLWFNKLSIPATYSRLITLATYLDSFGLGISDSTTYLGLYFGSTSNFVRLKTSSVPNNNEWYHVVLTCNGDVTSANSYNIYLNKAVLSTTSTSTFSACDNKSIIGARRVSTTPGYYFNGKIQDVRIYNRALSDKEINILYNMYNPNINKTLQINKENIIYTKGNIKEV